MIGTDEPESGSEGRRGTERDQVGGAAAQRVLVEDDRGRGIGRLRQQDRAHGRAVQDVRAGVARTDARARVILVRAVVRCGVGRSAGAVCRVRGRVVCGWRRCAMRSVVAGRCFSVRAGGSMVRTVRRVAVADECGEQDQAAEQRRRPATG